MSPSTFLLISAVIFALATAVWGVVLIRAPQRTTLGRQLLLAFTGVAFISVVPIVLVFIWQIQNTLTRQTGETFAVLATSDSQRLSVDLANEIALLQDLSQSEAIFNRISQTSESELGSLTAEERTTLLAERDAAWQTQDDSLLRSFVLVNAASNQLNVFRQRFAQHTDLLITDRFGALVATDGHVPPLYTNAAEPWWQKVWDNRFAAAAQVGDVQWVAGQAQSLVDIEIVFQAPNTNAFRGVLRSNLRLSQLGGLADFSPPGQTGEILVTDETGRVLHSSRPERVGSQIALLAEPWAQLTEENGRAIIRGQAPLVTVDNSLGFVLPTWYLIIQQEQDEALATVNQLTRISLVGALAALALAVLVGYQISRQLVRPIENLTQTATAIAGGNLRRTAERSGPQELLTLADAFNSTTSQLRQTLEGLEQRVEVRTAELNQRVEQLGLINQVGQHAISQLDTTTVLPHITRILRTSANYSAAIIFLLDEEHTTLYVGAADPPDLDGRVPLGQGVVGRVAHTAETMVVNTAVAGTPDFLHAALPPTQAEIALPLRVGANILGVLDLHSTQAGAFGPDTVAVLATMADQIAIALYNGHLFSAASAARQEAERADQIKSQFLANMSHELRTPLNAIINFTGFVSDELLGEVNEEQVDALSKVLSSSDHLLSLINDVLDLSKIETGQMSLFLQDVDLNALLHSASATAKGLMKDTPLVLTVEMDEQLPVVRGDKRRLRQIMLNLISNAVKFTLEGGITLRAIHDNGAVHIMVVDTGIGIAPEDHELVFHSFRQAQHSLYNVSGTGLGLPITKHFVEAHGGRIWLESELGRGSTFHVLLPIDGVSE